MKKINNELYIKNIYIRMKLNYLQKKKCRLYKLWSSIKHLPRQE